MATTTDFINTTAQGRSSSFSGSTSPSSVSESDECITQMSSGRRGNGADRRSRKWRKLLKKVVEESKKSLYGSSKPLIFRYDAVSYSMNFDEGNHLDDYYLYGRRCSQASREWS